MSHSFLLNCSFPIVLRFKRFLRTGCSCNCRIKLLVRYKHWLPLSNSSLTERSPPSEVNALALAVCKSTFRETDAVAFSVVQSEFLSAGLGGSQIDWWWYRPHLQHLFDVVHWLAWWPMDRHRKHCPSSCLWVWQDVTLWNNDYPYNTHIASYGLIPVEVVEVGFLSVLDPLPLQYCWALLPNFHLHIPH